VGGGRGGDTEILQFEGPPPLPRDLTAMGGFFFVSFF